MEDLSEVAEDETVEGAGVRRVLTIDVIGVIPTPAERRTIGVNAFSSAR